MELRQLEYFVAVADEGTFTRAARRVHVAQSAVSATVQKLERELGLPLFAREGPTTTLTDAGAALLPEARSLLAAARHARDAVDQVRGGLRGLVRIGTLVSIGTRPPGAEPFVVDLPQVLGVFHVTHPLVSFTLVTAPGGTAGHLADVAADALDVALVVTAGQPDGVRLRRIGTVRLSFVCPDRHPLAGAGSVTLADLAGETFVDFPRGWGSRTVTDRAFAAAGVERAVPFEAADQDSALGLVRHGLGVTLMPRTGSEREGLSVIEVADTDLDLPVSLALPAGRRPSAATAALVEMITRAAR